VTLDDGFYWYDPNVDVINVHYMSQREPRAALQHVFYGSWSRETFYRFGNVASFVAARWAAPKAIGFDETYTGIPDGLGPRPAQNRMEAWESLLGGCAVYDHLDFSFTPDDPTGSGAGSIPPGVPLGWLDGRTLRRHLGYVARYAAALDLGTLRPDPLAVIEAPPGIGAVACQSMGRHGPVVSVYLADMRRFEAGYGTTPLGGALWLAGLPPATPFGVWSLDPRTGEWTSLPPSPAAPGEVRIDLPCFTEDLLVHVEAVGQ
jgi:hypothetical protein